MKSGSRTSRPEKWSLSPWSCPRTHGKYRRSTVEVVVATIVVGGAGSSSIVVGAGTLSASGQGKAAALRRSVPCSHVRLRGGALCRGLILGRTILTFSTPLWLWLVD